MHIWTVTVVRGVESGAGPICEIYHGCAKSSAAAIKKAVRLAAQAGMAEPQVSSVKLKYRRDF